MNFSYWVRATRPRTLPLAASVIGTGAIVAYKNGAFDGYIALSCLLTTLLLQIVSNLANDLGDTVHGADHVARTGPSRTVQSGAISMQAMKIAVSLFAVAAFASGIWLLIMAFDALDWGGFFVFLCLGMGCIFGALYYTLGKNPYGYLALGDLSVFIFFGPIGVLGSAFLISKGNIEYIDVLPALSLGCFSTAVLHLNNMRDILSDTMAGKKTVAIILGFAVSKYYLYGLLLFGLSVGIVYLWAIGHSVYVMVIPAYTMSQYIAKPVALQHAGDTLDVFLPKMALFTILFVLCLGISAIWL